MIANNLITKNAASSSEIAQQISAFRKSGGKIQRIKRGVSGAPAHSYNNKRVKK